MTPEQRTVLAHVVVDPDAWYSHAISHFGQEKADEFLAAKVRRYQSECEVAMAKPDYKTRAEREAMAESERQAAAAARLTKIAAAEAKKNADLDALITAKVAEALVGKGV